MLSLRLRRLLSAAFALGCFGALGMSPVRAQAATLTVTNLSDATTDGTCSAAENGDGCTLREAITAANSNADSDAIIFDSSLIGNVVLQSALPTLSTNLSITDLPGTVGISANGGNYSVLTARGANITLSGVSLLQSKATNGGGLNIVGGSAILNGLGVVNNATTNYGGGIYATNTTLTLNNCTVANNASVYGAGLFLESGTTLTTNNCTLANNTASSIGGGFYSRGNSATLSNCTISGNTGEGAGGGLFSFSPLTANSCTITGNTAPSGQGSGILIGNAAGGGLVTTLSNSIVAANNGTDLDYYNSGNSYASNGYNLVGTSGTNALAAFTATGDQTGVTSDQLKLSPLQNNGGGILTVALLPGSIAINGGNTEFTTDQRGVARPQGSADDVGAYEALPFNESLHVTTLTDEDDSTSDSAYGTGTSLREAINYANSNVDQSAITIDANLSGTIALQSALPDLSTNLSITDVPGTVIISAKGISSSVLRAVNGAGVALNGLGLRDGLAANGGGLSVGTGSSAVLDGCAIVNSTATQYGGGIYTQDGSVSLRGCDISGNTAAFGGGIFLQNVNQGSTLTLSQSAVYSNSVTQAGGGLYSRGSTSTLSNSSVFGNTATGGAGGIYNDAGTMTLSSCTVANNSAPAGVGGGLLTFTFGTTTTLSNTIVALNSGTDVDVVNGSTNNYASGGYNLLGSSGTDALTPFIQAGSITNVTSDQLKLGAPVSNGFRPVLPLLLGSVAINAGDPNVTFDPNSFDQRGTAPYYRVMGGRLDIGAYELQVLDISGTVYNAVALGGVSGITITATDTNGVVVTQTQTDSQGKYTLTLTKGSFTLTASKSGDATYRFVPLFNNPLILDAQTTTTYNFRAIGIGGRVISPSNLGISGVTVNLYAQSDTNRTMPLATSISNAQGFFSLDNVAQGTWLVVPVAPTDAYTYTPTSRTITVNNVAVFTSFTAAARNFVTGTVYNAVALNGLSGITIKAVKNGTTTVAGQTLTDSQGNYTLSLVPGTYNITASKENDATLRLLPLFTNPVTTKATTTTCQFRAIGIGGRIISPSNMGISGVTVNLYAQSDTALKTPLATSASDAQGFFSLDNVAQGTWLVVPTSAINATYAYTPSSRLVAVKDTAVFTSFTAAVRNLVTGKVYNAVAQNGLSGITIQAVKAGTTSVAAQVVTDEQGNYTLSLVPGTYNITASRAGDATLRLLPLFTNPVTTKATTTTCEFRAIGIGGRIISPSNIGISDVTVNLYAQTDTDLKTPLATSTSDAQGFFSLDNVAQGTWLVAPVAPTDAYTYTPATRLIQVANVAVFTSFQASARQSTVTRSVTGGPHSAVVLSSASANVEVGTLTLKFTGPLDAASVAELTHYGIAVDGVTVNVEDALLSGGDTIVLTLPAEVLTVSSQIAVSWAGVLDAHGLPVQGSTTLNMS